jgi:ABC-type multidrug transport system ATPase subunit
VDRTQLDESADVINHNTTTVASWDNHDYPIKAKGLSKIYPNGVSAVNNNTFCVKKGEVFGLLGPNGAGKSTMFNLMTMDLKRTNGEIKLISTDIEELSVIE